MFERGVAGTTIEAVQAAATVSASQLYHYFADKDDLVRAVIEHQADIIVGNQQSASLGTFEGLRAWRDMVVDLERRRQGRGGCPLGSLGSQLAETAPQARTDIAALQGGLLLTQMRRDTRPLETALDAMLTLIASFTGYGLPYDRTAGRERARQSRNLARSTRPEPGPPLGPLHHVELWVPDLARATAEWGWLLVRLGYAPFQDWPDGRSWLLGHTYLVIEQSPALTASAHDRLHAGLNHLAFHVESRTADGSLPWSPRSRPPHLHRTSVAANL